MEAALENKLFDTVKDLYLTKSSASDQIRKLFDICKRDGVQPMLYYTGHGEIGTGNWCFDDGTISIQEILDMLPGGVYYPMIFSDACYSGHWANFCLKKNIPGFHCLAACPEYSKAFDTKGEGGDLTLFMTGKKARPSTEPMYSGGNIIDFPVTTGYNSVEYTDFIGSHLFNSENVLICQNFHDGYFSGCFAPSKRYRPRPALSWGIQKNYDTFIKFVKEKWEWKNGRSFNIYSLACDENLGFGVFFMENYGTSQSIVTNLDDIEKKWKEGFMITACAARGSTFYVVMTKDTNEYKGGQSWFTCNSWVEAHNEIQKDYKEGRAITGICYSTGLGQYFVVMTETPKGQAFAWYRSDQVTARCNWEDEKYTEGFDTTIIFRAPADEKILFVMTQDENRLGYVSRVNYKMA